MGDEQACLPSLPALVVLHACPHLFPALPCPASSLSSGNGSHWQKLRGQERGGSFLIPPPNPVTLWPLFLSRHLSSSTAIALQGLQQHCPLLSPLRSRCANGFLWSLFPGFAPALLSSLRPVHNSVNYPSLNSSGTPLQCTIWFPRDRV